jgi:hypothetical protein
VAVSGSQVDWSLVVAVSALLFTVGSFWLLYARRGSLEVGQPGAYAFASIVRLRLPLAFYNTGAKSIIVTDLRVVRLDDPTLPPLRWIATVSQLRPDSGNERDFATPFAVEGRGTREIVPEFGDDLHWSPSPGTRHRMQLQAKLHHRKDEWPTLADFDWWSPPPGAEMDRYITYRNAPPDEQ